MKTIISYFALLALLTAVIIGCGQSAPVLTLSPDGYGKTVLPNGITLLVNRDETTSLSSARILIGGGVLTETPENNGLNNMMVQLLFKGNSAMKASQIAEKLDFLGVNMSQGGLRDYAYISLTSLTENFDEALGIVSRCLLDPTFPEDELAKLKTEMEGTIKSGDDNQTYASSKLFFKTIYGGDEYGLPVEGTLGTIGQITAENIKEHYNRYVGGDNIIISVATDMTPDSALTIIRKHFGGLKKESAPVTKPSMAVEPQKEGFISYDRNQSFIFMGYPLPHLTAPEVARIHLLHEIMGANVGSRLWDLRQKEKLAYSVYTQYTLDKYGSIFRAAIGTDTAKVKDALNSLDREWTLLIDSGITSEELTSAKINMKNNLIYRFDRKGNRADNMALYEYLGYGYHFIPELITMADGITADDINGFVRQSFGQNNRFLSIVGKK